MANVLVKLGEKYFTSLDQNFFIYNIVFLKGSTHEIKVWFLGSLDRKNLFNIPAVGFEFIISTF